MRAKVQLWILLSTFFVSVKGLNSDDFCEREDGSTGKCVHITECVTAQEDLKKHKRPRICAFDGIYPIVCCRQEEATEPPSFLTIYPLYTSTGTDGTISPTATTENIFSKTFSISEEKCKTYIKNNLTSTTSQPPDEFAVVGGELAFGGEFPHMAILGYGDEYEFEWKCGGSLISEEFVLTAAHCLYAWPLGDVKKVRLGDLDISRTDDDAEPQEFDVKETYVHPEFFPLSYYHDIALIKLDKPVSINDYVRPACLEIEKTIPSDDLLTATGWGASTFGGRRETSLQKVELFNLPQKHCVRAYGSNIQLERGFDEEIQICGGDLEKRVDTCQGDSGGPLQGLIPDTNKKYKIVGVTSFGIDCGLVPGIYVKISAYLPWIESIVWPQEHRNI